MFKLLASLKSGVSCVCARILTSVLHAQAATSSSSGNLALSSSRRPASATVRGQDREAVGTWSAGTGQLATKARPASARPVRDVVLTQISPTRTFWSLAHSYILGGGKLVLKIKMSGAERFWCLRSLLASVASPCARTATWLVSSESPRPALSCRLSHVTLAAL